LLIKGGRLVDPGQGLDQVMDLYVADGKVLALGEPQSGFEPDQELNAEGCIVCPGLIDLNAYLPEPGFEHKGTIASETRAAAKGGITTLCSTPETSPVVDTPAVIQLMLDRAEAAHFARVIPMAAMTVALQGETLTEMGSFEAVGCSVVYQASGDFKNNQVLRRAMEYAATHGLRVVIKPEDRSLRDGGCVHEGVTSTRLGLPGIPACAETMAVAQILALVAEYGVPVHLTQLSSARAMDLLRIARDQHLPVTADISISNLHFNDQYVGDFDPAYHVDPPLRSASDQDALKAAISQGLSTATSSGHRPHKVEAKLQAFPATSPGIASLESLLPQTLALVKDGVLTLSDALKTLTHGPAQILGLDAGHLQPGACADVCVFDPEAVWTVEPATWYSQGKNTPLMGQTLTGQVRWTLREGKVVYAH